MSALPQPTCFIQKEKMLLNSHPLLGSFSINIRLFLPIYTILQDAFQLAFRSLLDIVQRTHSHCQGARRNKLSGGAKSGNWIECPLPVVVSRKSLNSHCIRSVRVSREQ